VSIDRRDGFDRHPPAKAADPQLWTFCAGTQWVPVDQRLFACKAIIAGDETPANQAIARCNRSIAYNMKGDVDLAMAKRFASVSENIEV
jgi:hypothetical protein